MFERRVLMDILRERLVVALGRELSPVASTLISKVRTSSDLSEADSSKARNSP
jgi:hypothetical protein